ncbi:MAG: hypothetical protein RLY16_1726 [Bacteroidota bacterium]|jgi:hypothetical protein
MLQRTLVILACSLLMISCSSKKVRVFVDKEVEDSTTRHKIIFDNKDTFAIADTGLYVSLTPGRHVFVLNKEKEKEITVGPDGGILNLDNKEYVAFDIEYGSETTTGFEGLNIGNARLKSIILLDSMVVMPAKGMGRYSDSTLRKILPKLMKAKNGNYFGGIGPKSAGNYDSDYDLNDQIFGLKKFGKDRLFINKFWDFDVHQEVPKTLQVKTSKYAVGRSTTTRSAVMRANEFLFVALFSPEEFKVKTLSEIQSGKGDREEAEVQEERKEKEDAKKMKF